MYGVLLAIVCSSLDELSNSIGKKEVRDGIGSPYTFGFLTIFFGTLFFVVAGFLRGSFVFSLESLPFFIPRVLIETFQMHISMQLVVKADRADFGFLRMLTIPLLLIIDLTLGYSFSTSQFLGMGLIFLTIVALIYIERDKTKHHKMLILIALLGAVTISLFKYDITHYNSVEAEQAIIGLIIALYFFVMAVVKRGEDALGFLRVPAYSLQASASGLSEVLASYAYLFAPAAIIAAALRSSAVLFAIVSGRYYFHEKHFLIRLALFACISVALVLLI